MTVAATGTARSETLVQALSSAYANNPTLNAARASVRATDEFVPQALSGWRPTVAASADVGVSHTTSRLKAAGKASSTTTPGGVGISITQPLFRGYRTINQTKYAEASVLAAQQSLRATEQTVLFDAVTVFMDVIRDTAIVSLRASDLEFLRQQVQAARDRFDVGEGTKTDVSQAEARRAQADSSLNLARANLQASRANYQKVIGHMPKRLIANGRIGGLLPRNLDKALSAGLVDHPSIRASLHMVDSAAFNVKTIEGELLPTVTLEGSYAHRWEPSSSVSSSDSASLIGRLTVPLYQGGVVYSRVRQAKEELGEARIKVDVARDEVRAAIIASWGQLKAARASIIAARAQVRASQLALEGVIEEQRVGQRTTLDILDAQRELVNARVVLVTAERDRVVAAYALLSASGKLDAVSLGLRVAVYNPDEHYSAVRDKWYGLRTPDKR